MKKVLLGSTAVIGAAVMFAAPASAEMETAFSGFLKAELWGVGQDAGSYNSTTDVLSADDGRDYAFGVDDSEFHIKAKNTADNGLSYGVNLEVEITGNVTMDEAYLWFSGDDWGTLQLGGNEGASSSMPYSGDFSLTAAFGYDGGLGSVWNFQNAIVSPNIAGDTGDSAKINYFSPRFSGFQVGLSYQPDGGQGTLGDTLSANDGDDEDVIMIGANFVDTINGIDIGVGGAYTTASLETGAAATLEDTESLHVGFNVGFSGFTVGASYGDNFDSGCTTSGCDGGQFYEVAGGYGTGPWSLSVGWFHGEKDIATSQDEETDIISLGAKYSLAPGAVIIGEVNFVDEDNTATDNRSKNDGATYMVGTQISF